MDKLIKMSQLKSGLEKSKTYVLSFVQEAIKGFTATIKELETKKADKQHKHEAGDVSFEDGKTFQEKLDQGELKGAKGDTGETWVPTVSEAGELSWAKSSGAGTQPETKTIMGPAGKNGETGPKGDAGVRGSTWTVGKILSGTDSVTKTGLTGSFNAGDMYLNSGTWDVYTCTKQGQDEAAEWQHVCNIRGQQGVKGDAGTPGTAGAKGDTGPAPKITVKTAETVATPGTPTVTVAQQGENVTLTFDKLKGDTGNTGSAGPAGPAGPAGAAGPNKVTSTTTTDLTGLLKGDGKVVSAAKAGTDFVAPNGSITGSSGSCTGNAATATKLATGANINGVKFDGSGAITVYDNTKQAKVTNKTGTIPASWVDNTDTDTKAAGYLYKCVLSDAAIVAADTCIIDVAPASMSTAVQKGLAPFADSGAGNLTFYAVAKPTTTISIQYSIIKG